ncbi:preprotein translocase subunit SecE, partial [Patescibacteria group bacterium]|nr:preprotein translocase subunit SecE [Patescibacteria group bacterium]
KKIIQFIKEAIVELGKVTWPTRLTAIRFTIGVIIISAIFALFIGVVDIGLSRGVEALISWAGSRQVAPSSSQSVQVQPGDIQVETTPTQ